MPIPLTVNQRFRFFTTVISVRSVRSAKKATGNSPPVSVSADIFVSKTSTILSARAAVTVTGYTMFLATTTTVTGSLLRVVYGAILVRQDSRNHIAGILGCRIIDVCTGLPCSETRSVVHLTVSDRSIASTLLGVAIRISAKVRETGNRSVCHHAVLEVNRRSNNFAVRFSGFEMGKVPCTVVDSRVLLTDY